MACCDVIDILRTLRAGTQVNVYFDNIAFAPVQFQFFNDNQVAITGGFTNGLTYIQATDIQAIRVVNPNQQPALFCDDCEHERCCSKKNKNDCFCCEQMEILKKLHPGATVTVRFGIATVQGTFQFLCGNMAVISLPDGSYIYIKLSEIYAITTDITPNCTDTEDCECEKEQRCRKNKNQEMCCSPMDVLFNLNPGTTVILIFDGIGFNAEFTCMADDMAVFTDGSFGTGFTYVKACKIRSVTVSTTGTLDVDEISTLQNNKKL